MDEQKTDESKVYFDSLKNFIEERRKVLQQALLEAQARRAMMEKNIYNIEGRLFELDNIERNMTKTEKQISEDEEEVSDNDVDNAQ